MTRRATNIVYTESGKTCTYEDVRKFILKRDPVCQICGEAPSIEVDHVWPLYYGGDDHSGNLQGVCLPCNRAKGNKVTLWDATPRQLLDGLDAILERYEVVRDQMWDFLYHAGHLEPAEYAAYEWQFNYALRQIECMAENLVEHTIGDARRRHSLLLAKDQEARNEQAAELSEVSP